MLPPNPVIVGIEMAGMFASAVQFAEQTFDFFKHGSPTQYAPKNLRLALSLTHRRPYGRALPDGFAPSGLSSSKTKSFSTRGWRGGFAQAAARAKFPRKMQE